MSTAELQKEIITASGKIYSFRRLVKAVLHKKGLERILFIGEYFWQKDIRRELRGELKYLENLKAYPSNSK